MLLLVSYVLMLLRMGDPREVFVLTTTLLDHAGTLPSCWSATLLLKVAATGPMQLSQTVRLMNPPCDKQNKQRKASREFPLSPTYLQISVYMLHAYSIHQQHPVFPKVKQNKAGNQYQPEENKK